jgi:hypothetical protein
LDAGLHQAGLDVQADRGIAVPLLSLEVFLERVDPLLKVNWGYGNLNKTESEVKDRGSLALVATAGGKAKSILFFIGSFTYRQIGIIAD